MRFLERATKALGYHRRPYLAAVVVSFIFSLLSFALLTAASLNQSTKHGFQTRLKQFDTSAIKSAKRLLAKVWEAYAHVGTQYTHWWWLSIAILAAIACGFAVFLAIHRQQETTAYLLVGKGIGDIVAQYLLENVAVFVVGFGFAWIAVSCFTAGLTQLLLKLNLHLFDAQLTGQVSQSTFATLTKQLFAHRITDFSGDALVFGHRGPRPQTGTISGVAATFGAGVLAVAVPQLIVFTASAWHTRRRLRHLR